MSLKIVGGAVAAVVVLIVAVVALMFGGLLPNPFIGAFLDPPEYSARYYPRDTLAYGWLTLYPEGGQREQLVDLWDRFNEYRVVSDEIEDLQEEFEDDTGLSIEDDLMTWIGPDVSVGLVDMGGDDPLVLVAFRVRNTGDARDFMEEYADYLEDEEGNDFDYDEVDGVDVWIDENDLGFALADDVLLMVFGYQLEESLEDLLDLVSGEEDRSLAEEEGFQAARALLPDRRFASGYVNIEEIVAMADDHYYSSEFRDLATLGENADFPEWAVVSAQFIDRGVVVEAVAPNTDSYGQDLPNLDNPADWVSHNSIGLIAATFDPNLDNWRERIDEFWSEDENLSSLTDDIYYEIYREVERESSDPPRLEENPDIVDVLDLGLELVEVYTDINLEEDFLDHLGGTLIMAVDAFNLAHFEDDPEEERSTQWPCSPTIPTEKML